MITLVDISKFNLKSVCISHHLILLCFSLSIVIQMKTTIHSRLYHWKFFFPVKWALALDDMVKTSLKFTTCVCVRFSFYSFLFLFIVCVVIVENFSLQNFHFLVATISRKIQTFTQIKLIQFQNWIKENMIWLFSLKFVSIYSRSLRYFFLATYTNWVIACIVDSITNQPNYYKVKYRTENEKNIWSILNEFNTFLWFFFIVINAFSIYYRQLSGFQSGKLNHIQSLSSKTVTMENHFFFVS